MNKIDMDKIIVNLIDDNKDIDIDINDDSNEEINIYSDNLQSQNIIINLHENTTLTLNLAGNINKDIDINILVRIIGNNNKCYINTRSINLNGNSKIEVNTKVYKDTINNIVVEDLKAINEDGNISLFPILEIDTNEVDASHFATVGYLDQDELFYLESKGINEENARNLLKRVFIYKIFTKDFLDTIK